MFAAEWRAWWAAARRVKDLKMLVLRRVVRLVGVRGGEGVREKGVKAMGFGSLVVGRLGWWGWIVGGWEEWAVGLEVVLSRVV